MNPRWIEIGDAIALALMAIVLAGSFLTFGYAREDLARALAWAACSLLGAWGAVGLITGRFSGERDAAARTLMVTAIVVVIVTSIFVVPLPRGIVVSLSPAWAETVAAMEKAKVSLPATLTLAQSPMNAARGWSEVVALAGWFASVILLAMDSRNARKLVRLFLMVCIGGGILGLLRFALGATPRAYGIVFNPNHHAALTLAGLPLAFIMLFTQGRNDPSVTGKDRQLAFGALMLAGFLGWLASISRGSVLFGGVVLIGWASFELVRRRVLGRIRRRLIPALLVLLIGGCAAAGLVLEGYAARFAKGTTTTNRIVFWEASWEALVESRFLGIGPGGVEFAIPRFANEMLQRNPSFTHNDLLQCVTELGVPGTLIIVAFGFFAIRAIWRRGREVRPDFGRRAAEQWRALMAGVLTMLAHALVDFHLRIPVVAMTALIAIALLATDGLPTACAEEDLHV